MPRKKTKNTFRRGGEQRYVRYAHTTSSKRSSTHSTTGIQLTTILFAVIAAGALTMTVIMSPQITRQTSLILQNIPALPQVAISKPQISLPSFSLPAISLPEFSLPSVDVRMPSVSVPSVNTEGIGKYAGTLRSGVQSTLAGILYGIQALIRMVVGLSVWIMNTFIQFCTLLGRLVVTSTTSLWRIQILVMKASLALTTFIARMVGIGFLYIGKAVYAFLAGFVRFMIGGVVAIANGIVTAFKLIITGIVAIGRGIAGLFIAVGNKINAFNQKVSNSADATGRFFAPYITFITGSFKVAIDYFLTGLSDMKMLAGQLTNEYQENTKQFNEKKN